MRLSPCVCLRFCPSACKHLWGQLCASCFVQVRLVVSPGSRGAGVGSRLLSCALGFAASCRCRSIEVFANSLNASSASFFRNRHFELVQVVRRKLMRGRSEVCRLSAQSGAGTLSWPYLHAYSCQSICTLLRIGCSSLFIHLCCLLYHVLPLQAYTCSVSSIPPRNLEAVRINGCRGHNASMDPSHINIISLSYISLNGEVAGLGGWR